ncbi:MAG: 4-hydroxy-3-methylbut-2-enyl diphosphate reductase [Synergistaceae bacterium]|jgi:4-hydroxy-3-methylbut-2-enyl diphosphate reductase|nr:4-hydroxy-3-methylbut-2-enyl diphosphate reductase [Synergistaceae bacterium]
MNFVSANPTGLCFGVRRAIERLEAALEKYGKVYSLGSPIHNPQEVGRLSSLGLEVASDVRGISEDSVAFIRAHGVTRSESTELESRCRVVIDGTCPFVRRAQSRAESLSADGYRVVVLGDPEHPEVKGILGYIDGESLVINGANDIDCGRRYGKIGILSQTTQKEETLAEIVSKFVFLADDIKVYNTVCQATIERRKAVKKLAALVSVLLVIGGKNSANTRELFEIAKNTGVPSLWVEHAGEVDWGWLKGRGTIGVAAGGSTPDWLINELTCKLKRL